MIFAATERLDLRRPRMEDLPAYLRSWDDPEMSRYTTKRENVRGFLTDLFAEMQAKEPGDLQPQPWYQLTIERREDGAVVGDLGLGFDIPGEQQVELGYRIHPDHHRQGYAREAVAGAIGWLIKRHAVHRFIGVVAAPNISSERVLRSLGFRQEGLFRQSFRCDGAWVDDLYFALLASEWRGAGATAG
jgi:RimJ/RimL family protein N-acetyltransferase